MRSLWKKSKYQEVINFRNSITIEIKNAKTMIGNLLFLSVYTHKSLILIKKTDLFNSNNDKSSYYNQFTFSIITLTKKVIKILSKTFLFNLLYSQNYN